MTRHAAFLAAVALLAACSSRPVVIRAVPDDAASLRLFYNLAGAVDVPKDHIYLTLDGRLAVEDLPPEATAHTTLPLLAVEARRTDGCLLANATAQGFELTLRPVADCGRPPTPPTQPPQTIVDITPQPPQDSDGDGVLDGADLCPDTAAGATPSPTRKGCPDGDADGDGVADSLDVCPTQPSGKYPDLTRRGCPQPDRDSDGIPDSLDKCPALSAGPTASTSRPGCPAPVDVVIPLGPPTLSGSVMASGADAYAARAAFDFTAGKAVLGHLEWPVNLPAEASTASSIVLSYDLSAALAWGATSSSCAAGSFLVRGAGTSQVCVSGGLEDVLLVDGQGNAGGAGMVPTFSRLSGGNALAQTSSKIALRLSLRGDVVASQVKASVRITMSW